MSMAAGYLAVSQPIQRFHLAERRPIEIYACRAWAASWVSLISL